MDIDLLAGSICEELENSVFCSAPGRFILLQSIEPPPFFDICSKNVSQVHSPRPFLIRVYQGKDQAQHGEVPLNTFFLKDATIVEVPFSKHNKSCVFEIQFSTTTGNKDRTLVLEAESEADRAEWVKDLTSHLDTVSDHSRLLLPRSSCTRPFEHSFSVV